MAHYRIYMVNVAGNIQSGADFICDTDAEACFEALSRVGKTGTAEVWRGIRRVCIETQMPLPKADQLDATTTATTP